MKQFLTTVNRKASIYICKSDPDDRTLTYVIERVWVHARGMLEPGMYTREHTVTGSARRLLNSRSILTH